MKHSYGAGYQNILIRPLEENDIEKLRVWRNDDSQTKYLRKIDTITPEMQKKWYDNYLKDQNVIAFAIDETEQLKRMVGSVSLYHFNGKVAEIGRIQIGDMEARGKGIGGKSFVLAMQIGFRQLGLEKITASVHRENAAAYKSYMKIGFCVTGSHPAPMGGIEDEIEINETMLAKANCYTDEIKFLCEKISAHPWGTL